MQWLQGRGQSRKCPACHVSEPTHLVLQIRSALPPHLDLQLERCDACGSAFFADFTVPAYEEVWGGGAALDFYQEQGAGIDVMLTTLYAVPHRGVRRFLEIGCGFGFSVDFASRILGWRARGIDPGPAARLGRTLLDVRIDDAYLTSEGAAEGEASDLMLCSEVIEHIADPDPFLAVLAAHLTEDGTVLLTTPNAAAIAPGTSPATLVPLLSAGYHVVLYSPKGLQIALERAGFDSVVVADWGHTLRAGAARGRCDADFSCRLDRNAYRDYLRGVAARAQQCSALSLGMYSRLLKEALNAEEYHEAEAAIAPLRAALKEQWVLDLDAPDTMPLDGPTPSSLEDLHRAHPFNLTTILYMVGTLRLVQGRSEEAAFLFAAASKAADRIRVVLRAIGSDDGETEELGWRSRANLARLSSLDQPGRAGAIIERFATQADNPLGEHAPSRIVDELRQNAFVSLVNASQYDAADRIASAVERMDIPRDAAGISLKFALGILELNHRASPKQAWEHFEEARKLQEGAFGAPHPNESFIWPLRFHEGLAALRARDRPAGHAALLPLLEPDAAYGSPQSSYAENASKLARDHGLVRRVR